MMTVEEPSEIDVVASSSAGAKEGSVRLEDERRGSTTREKPATPSEPVKETNSDSG